MDGVLIIDKPAGITSHDVVDRVRRILGTRRVGHTGTLDPFATGVMVVVVGRATRLAQFLDTDEKEYEATVRFGFETDTGDKTGNRRGDAETQRCREITLADVEAVLPRFHGEIEQLPPMYSAKKVGGKKLYESARKGIDVERKPQQVTIRELSATPDSLSPDLELGTWNLELRAVCSAGTYIRTLAEDIGRAVGVGAHLTELRRTRSGRFDFTRSITLDALAEMADPASILLPMDTAVEHLLEFKLSPDRVDRTRNGMSTRIEDAPFTDGENVRMTAETGELIAIGRYSSDESSVKPVVVLV